MIKNSDEKNWYDYQLSKEYRNFRDMWSILKHFLKGEKSGCCIKRNKANKHMAVFTSGKNMDSPYKRCDPDIWECVDYQKEIK